MRQTAEWLTRGWTCDGTRFRCIYAHVPDDGFMLSRHGQLQGRIPLGIWELLFLKRP